MKKVYTYRLVATGLPEEEDHSIYFTKEFISKMWFEWNEYSGQQEFEMETVNVSDCGDQFLESLKMSEDVKALYRRFVKIYALIISQHNFSVNLDLIILLVFFR